jgi:hypothetical protein
MNNQFLDNIKELERALLEKGITLEVKVASSRRLNRKFHDRYVLGSNILWNLPPASSVLDGQSSQFKSYRAGTES